MSGLNFLLWTIAVLIILSVVIYMAKRIFAIIYISKHKDELERQYRRQHPTIWDRLEEQKRLQEEMIKEQKHNQQ